MLLVVLLDNLVVAGGTDGGRVDFTDIAPDLVSLPLDWSLERATPCTVFEQSDSPGSNEMSLAHDIVYLMNK